MESYGNLNWSYFVFFAYALAAVTLAGTAFYHWKKHKIAEQALKEESTS